METEPMILKYREHEVNTVGEFELPGELPAAAGNQTIGVDITATAPGAKVC